MMSLALGAGLWFIWGVGSAHAEVHLAPETEIEISIYDLLNRQEKESPKTGATHSKKTKTASPKPEGPRLARDYGPQVAKTLESLKSELEVCVDQDDVGKNVYRVHLAIAGDGRASPKVEGGKASSCLVAILSKSAWPSHPLGREVKVSFPIELERKKI